jgi:hypothetical protein
LLFDSSEGHVEQLMKQTRSYSRAMMVGTTAYDQVDMELIVDRVNMQLP